MTNQSGKSRESKRPDGVRVTAPKCVRCKQPVAARFRPFCSQRCSDLDLAGWLTGQYKIQTDETPDGSEQLDQEERDL